MRITILLLFFVVGCSPRCSDAYLQRYAYVKEIREARKISHQKSLYPQMTGEEPFICVVLVEAPHLDYTSPENFFETLHYGIFLPRHPTIGHAWILLKGIRDDQPYIAEFGHTGEFGLSAPRYFDEVVRRCYAHDPNPVQYFFSLLPDGQLQRGSGGHRPTLAVAFSITEDQFRYVQRVVQHYEFRYWGLQGPHCVHLVRECLSAIDIPISCTETIQIPQWFTFRGKKLRLWSDDCFSAISLATPDLLERSLFEKVRNGSALLAMNWYRSFCREKDRAGSYVK